MGNRPSGTAVELAAEDRESQSKKRKRDDEEANELLEIDPKDPVQIFRNLQELLERPKNDEELPSHLTKRDQVLKLKEQIESLGRMRDLLHEHITAAHRVSVNEKQQSIQRVCDSCSPLFVLQQAGPLTNIISFLDEVSLYNLEMASDMVRLRTPQTQAQWQYLQKRRPMGSCPMEWQGEDSVVLQGRMFAAAANYATRMDILAYLQHSTNDDDEQSECSSTADSLPWTSFHSLFASHRSNLANAAFIRFSLHGNDGPRLVWQGFVEGRTHQFSQHVAGCRNGSARVSSWDTKAATVPEDIDWQEYRDYKAWLGDFVAGLPEETRSKEPWDWSSGLRRSSLQFRYPFTEAFMGHVGRVIPFFHLADGDLKDDLMRGEAMTVAKLLIERQQEKLENDGQFGVTQQVTSEVKHSMASIIVSRAIREAGVRSIQGLVEREMGNRVMHSLLLERNGLKNGAQVNYSARIDDKRIDFRVDDSGSRVDGGAFDWEGDDDVYS